MEYMKKNEQEQFYGKEYHLDNNCNLGKSIEGDNYNLNNNCKLNNNYNLGGGTL